MVTGCHVGGIPFCDCCEAIMVPVPPPGKQHVQTGVPHKELVRNIDISRTVLMTMFQWKAFHHTINSWNNKPAGMSVQNATTLQLQPIIV